MFPIRAVEDDHVDRTGVEAQQCVKLTVTNSSIDFFVPIVHAHQAKLDDLFCLHADVAFGHYAADGAPNDWRRTSVLYGCQTQTREKATHSASRRKTCSNQMWLKPPSFSIQQHMHKHVPVAFRRPGGYRGAAAPVPIPNTAVKRPSANGTPS